LDNSNKIVRNAIVLKISMMSKLDVNKYFQGVTVTNHLNLIDKIVPVLIISIQVKQNIESESSEFKN
jgi:hypothetical protein